VSFAVLLLDSEGGSQNATLLLVLGISSLKIPKAFLIRSATKLCIHIRTDIANRSTISDFSLISH